MDLDLDLDCLAECYKESSSSFLKDIRSQLDKLSDEVVEVEIVDNAAAIELNISKLKSLKAKNLFAAKHLCESILQLKSLTSIQKITFSYELCHILFHIGPFPAAISKLEELLSYDSDLESEQAMKHKVYMLLGHCYRVIGKLVEATASYQSAKDTGHATSCEDHIELAFIYQQFCVYSSGSNDEPINKLKPLTRKASLSTSTKGTLHQVLGNIYRSAADFHNAKYHFKESIRLAKEEKDLKKIMERKAELGRVYRSSGCYSKAIKRQEKFLDFARHSHGSIYDIATACGYIGFTYYSMGRPFYEQSIKFLYCKLNLSKTELKDVSGYRWCLNNIGKVYLAVNEFEKCIKLFTESSEIAKQIGNTLGLGTAYGNLGSAFRAIGKHNEAIKFHKLYLEIAEKNFDTGGAVIMLNELLLDHLYLYNEQQDEVSKTALLVLARQYGFKALRTAHEVKMWLKHKDDTLKIGNFEKNQAKTYSLLQYVLIEQCLYEAGFLVSELGRAQALADLVKDKLKLDSNIIIDEIVNISDDEGNLLSDRVCSVIAMVGSLLSKVKSHLLFYSIVDNVFVPMEALLYCWHVQTLSGGEVKIRFFQSNLNKSRSGDKIVFDENYIASLLLEIQGTTPVRLVKEMEPDNSKETSSRDIIKKKTASRPAAKIPEEKAKLMLEQLYSLLIQPILKDVPYSTSDIRLIIIPYNFLFSVPFSALRGSDHYLIEKFVISLIPSVSILQLALLSKERPSCHKELKILAIGNPKMPLDEIEQLPGAEKEVKSLLSIIDGKLMTGTVANKEDVIKCLPDFPIIHFATHAMLEDSLDDHIDKTSARDIDAVGDYSVKGAVVLAKSHSNCSGVLTSSEIMEIDLNCELVVLSCCNTARGKVTSDGVLGLSRSLLCSGVTNMILTLWPIQDKSTSVLMEHFYHGYKSNHDAATALRHAVLFLIKERYKVEHWAAFCNFGISLNVEHKQQDTNNY